ncbi:MAG: hypothetical protein OEM18_05735 [Nitrosopumilus sp.]|nr:hypothetical protein [Nitrosopumilus sp.]
MMEEMFQNLCLLKKEFAQIYSGTSHIQEIIPLEPSKKFPIDEKILNSLHMFAEKNPIYYNSYHDKILDVPCIVYEGDINEYWLNSIKHGSSCQPFYPTWILSAYFLVLMAKKFGVKELIDIGSGDGRIAYCGKISGLVSHGIEIDDVLADLQKTIMTSTKIDFDPNCSDALEFDYTSLKLACPVFFIGGLPQMGGDMLATGIIEKIQSIPNLKKNTCLVFAGSNSKRQLSGNQKSGGWSSLIDKYNLQEITTISLPTVWTFDQTIDTPYIYTSFN